jgi:hypothetical protein
MGVLPLTPNPYEHLPDHFVTLEQDAQPHHQQNQEPYIPKEKSACLFDGTISTSATQPLSTTTLQSRKLPSGCVGAYTRAVRQASWRVTQLIKEQRKAQFAGLTEDEQRQTGAAWIDACSSDESLPLVRDMIRNVDVDGFYVGSDGTETCALHAAAFSGAHGILEFLCQGIHERCPAADGGLALVNLPDANRWTALHFAAGANGVSAAQVLIRHGANLTVEAANGYTPLQWAQRLSNQEVAQELQRHHQHQHQELLLPFHQQYGDGQGRWERRGPPLGPLTNIAHRFLAMIPTHS